MASLRGRIAEVTVNIPAGSVGEVLLPANESTHHMIARSADGGAIARGTTVRVVETMGSVILVEPVRTNTAATESSTSSRVHAEE
jgi:membrane-bound ClpP family serine protease